MEKQSKSKQDEHNEDLVNVKRINDKACLDSYKSEIDRNKDTENTMGEGMIQESEEASGRSSRQKRSAEMLMMAQLKMQEHGDVTKITMNEKIDIIAQIWKQY